MCNSIVRVHAGINSGPAVNESFEKKRFRIINELARTSRDARATVPVWSLTPNGRTEYTIQDSLTRSAIDAEIESFAKRLSGEGGR
jgi:hypothetical protein